MLPLLRKEKIALVKQSFLVWIIYFQIAAMVIRVHILIIHHASDCLFFVSEKGAFVKPLLVLVFI